MFQVQPLSQRDPRWANTLIGTDPTLTIGKYGCLLTDLVMVVNGFGQNETPDSLNKKMTAAGGFDGPNVIPARLPRVLPVSFIGFERYPDDPAPMDRIDAALAAGKPVIVEVDSSPAPGLQNHWVVIYDKAGDDYVIVDPWTYPGSGRALLTQRFGGPPAQTITAVVWMDKAAVTPSAYILGVDVWEGNLEIDEPVLSAAGVKFMIVRLNSTSGELHKDDGFDKQWKEAANFVRWPYFVYSPWYSGRENFDWLVAHMPDEARAVSIDVELRKAGYDAHAYANEVQKCVGLARENWNINIYTGGWFLMYLDPWPMDTEYWWARYPGSMYPDKTTYITWEVLTQKVNTLPWSLVNAPGPCRLWQCTADRYVLPGCGGTAVDVNLWNGTLAELEAWAGKPATPAPSWAEAITAWARTMGYTGPQPE